MNKWLGLGANLGVLIGILFLVLEIRTNTESNTIGIHESYAANFVEMNSTLASEEFATVWQKAESGAELSPTERTQFVFIIRMYFSQANLMRRLYERGIATEDELREAYGPLRSISRRLPIAKEIIIEISELGTATGSNLVLEEDGIENFIRSRR